jgi:hypothetical protein
MGDTAPRNSGPADVNTRAVVAVLLPVVAGYAALFVYAMHHTSYDVWGALLAAPILIALSVPLLMRYAKTDSDHRIGSILIAALVFKLAFAIPRYYMVTVIYGTGDSLRYDHAATELRPYFLKLDFSVAHLGEGGTGGGTRFIEIVTGIIYTIFGPSIISGFLVFSWLSFWGLFFFYRAFRVGVPDGDARRYALLLFFLPSMLFWPSSIGKEAWMTFAIGITSYGCALLLARRRGASIYLIIGLAATMAVRPHMALLVIAGLGLAYLLRSQSTARAVALGKLRTAFGLGVIGLGTMLVIRRVSAFFGIDDFNLDTAVDTLEYAEGQTAQGGSEFVGGGPSLRDLPVNIVTVLFRPFAFEVNNLQALIAALEGTLLLILVVLSIPRLRGIPRRLRKQPYITYCVVYAVLFCFMFSAFQNFGILARQRVLVFPLILVLLALPLAESAKGRSRSHGRSNRQSVTSYAADAATRE